MSLMSLLTGPDAGLLSCRRTGWVGIDLGTDAIKFAQVSRQRGQWQLDRSLIVPVSSTSGSPAGGDSLVQSLREARTSAGFRRRRSACALSMAAMELQTLELPEGTDQEIEQMVSAELSTDHVDGLGEREFAFWKSPPAAEQKPATALVTVVSLVRTKAEDHASAQAAAGFRCQVLDCLPFALARAVAMQNGSGSEPVAALDWGATAPQLTIVSEGRPRFTRPLRECGTSQLVNSLCKGFDISAGDARQLLSTYGFSTPSGTSEKSQLQQVTGQFAAGPLERIVAELNRTLLYLQRQQPRLVPRRIILFGAGATIRNACEVFTERLGTETSLWQLNAEQSSSTGPDPHQSLLGPAIALSALGCES